MTTIHGKLEHLGEGNYKLFVSGAVLSFGTEVEAISKRGNVCKVTVLSTTRKVRDGYFYDFMLVSDVIKVEDLDNLLGLL